MDRPNHYYRKIRTAPKVTRILIGAGLVIGGILGFLPVLGVWMIPLGLVVIFFDVPWVKARWLAFRLWWKQKHKQFS